MNANAWALRLYAGDTLADKLVPYVAEGEHAAASGAPLRGTFPAIPGRPIDLRFSDGRAPFPGDHELGHAEARGRALHFFANHELLALEVMAHALLRFPDAPPALRAGLVGIIGDEQRHLAGYLARMAGTGVRFGDLPVNRYFWDALSGADLPGLIAGLSLTFEQANLDFAAHYAIAFRRVDDEDTAAALDAVLADEIRHVRHGLVWFERLCLGGAERAGSAGENPGAGRPEDTAGPADRSPEGRPDLAVEAPPPPGGGTRDPDAWWAAWTRVLPPPLTPARAKGARFFVGPRRAAGFDDATITRLSVFSASKGRPPHVFSFHPAVEADVAGDPPSTISGKVEASFGSLTMFLAHPEDVVLVHRRPSAKFLATILAAGFTIPEIVEGGPAALVGRPLGALRPWGWGPSVCTAYAPLGGPAWNPAWRRFYEKSWGVERLRERPDLVDPAVIGVVCHSWDEVRAATSGAVVWKAPLGTAGRGLRRPEDPDAQRWAEEILASQGAIVVEPWLDRVLDLSVQLDVTADRVAVAPWGRFLADGRGRYQGAVLGDVLRGQLPAVKRLLAEQGPRLGEMANHVGRALADGGFRGSAGIDALVYRDGDAVRLKPLVEVNPRATMGRIAAAIGRRVRRDRVGLWVQVTRKRVGDLVVYARALQQRAPLEVLGDPPLIASGALITSDPAVAQGMITALVVASSLEACWELLALDRSKRA